MQDDILLTLAEDKVTKGHATERVKELFSEIVLGEREILIERLGTQITEIRLRCEEWKRKYDKLKEEADSLEKNYGSERLANEQLKNGATTEMAGLKEQIYQLKLELKNSEAYVT